MENRKKIIAVIVAVLIISLALIVFSMYFNRDNEKVLESQQTGDLKSADPIQVQSDEMDRQREEALRISGAQEVPQVTEEQIQAQSEEMDAVRERTIQTVDQQTSVVPQPTEEQIQKQSDEMDALRDKKL